MDAAPDAGSIPGGADAAGSLGGRSGALATTDAEGSEGSDAGIARALADAGVDDGAVSCGCLEQAASANNAATERRERPVFIGGMGDVAGCRRISLASAGTFLTRS